MNSYEQLGKMLLVGAVLLALGGAVLIFLGKIGIPKLPGDLVFKRDGVKIFIPLATMVVVSVLLTVVVNVVFWLFRR
ncbi:MAG: DUF2905 family protein [Candidatus Aquicultorales bacterium]